jgi:hypothetical protein
MYFIVTQVLNEEKSFHYPKYELFLKRTIPFYLKLVKKCKEELQIVSANNVTLFTLDRKSKNLYQCKERRQKILQVNDNGQTTFSIINPECGSGRNPPCILLQGFIQKEPGNYQGCDAKVYEFTPKKEQHDIAEQLKEIKDPKVTDRVVTFGDHIMITSEHDTMYGTSGNGYNYHLHIWAGGEFFLDEKEAGLSIYGSGRPLLHGYSGVLKRLI